MEFLTDHLLDLRLTEPEFMKASTDVQHENFARQLSAFEKLLVISHARLSIPELYKNFKLMLRAGNRGMLKIGSIDSLIECIELYKASNTDDESQKVSKFFDNFLKEVKHLARINQFFHRTIYHCLYQFFYDPAQDNSDDEFQHEDTTDEEEDNRSEDGRHLPQVPDHGGETKQALTQPPTDIKLNIAPTVKRKKKKKRKARLNLLNNIKNKRKRVDNRMKVLEQIQMEKAEKARLPDGHKLEEQQSGREFERLRNKTDRQRLAFSVKNISNIKHWWDELITTGPISASSFDDDSLRVVRDYKNYLPFEAVFRLLPDNLVKGFKLVELSKIWYNSARRLEGVEPSTNQTVQDFFSQIDFCDQDIEAMADEIKQIKNQRVAKQTERKLLMNQILRFDEVKENYERCVERERELKDYYKQLKGERNSEYPKLETLARDDPEYKETYDQIQYLAESMKSVYRELQTASYELELVKQDYTVGMDNRTNLIRRHNDVRSCIRDIDVSLPQDKENMSKSCYLCDKLRGKVAQAWVALYKTNANQLLTEQADILLQCKYSTHAPINTLSKAVASDSEQQCSSSDEAEQLEEALDNALTTEMEEMERLKRADTRQSDLDEMKKTPFPPLEPAADEKEPVVKQKSVLNSEYNPSTAGILDRHEAKQYRERVDRLKKKFELDLSGLQKPVDCNVDVPTVENAPVQELVANMESGDEADMDSDQEVKSFRPQSKKLVKRNPERYSPLSDTSDDYIYQQQIKHSPAKTPKTIYILKKSEPRGPPQNRYILKTVKGAKLLPQNTLNQQKPTNKPRPSKPQVRQWGNDYKSLQALDNNYVNTLSVYKSSPLLSESSGYTMIPLEQGVFTPNVQLSDGDISIDSGTGNSLDSDDDDSKMKNKSNLKNPTGYKHKPRMTVREQFAATKISQNPASNRLVGNKPSKLPHLQRKMSEAVKNKFLSVESPTLSKSSPESLESRPIMFKQSVNKPAARNTLHMRKKVQPPAPRQQPKPTNETHPLAPTKRVAVGKLVERKLPMGKVPKSIQQPKIVPRKQHARVIESPNDDSIDEIFKQSTVSRSLPPKPSLRVGLQPTRPKRKYGIHHSLAKVK